jgi:hypothetical protein
MSCVFIVLKYVLEVVACTAPRFWHRKCRYPRIRGFMPIPQVPQFPMYGFICIFIGPKYIPTYHPHTSNPQGPSQPRMYTPNPQCPLSAKCDRGSQHMPMPMPMPMHSSRGDLPYRKVQRSVASLNLVFECYIMSHPRLWAVAFTSDELGTMSANPHPNR